MRLRDPDRWPIGAKNMRRELGVLTRGNPREDQWHLLVTAPEVRCRPSSARRFGSHVKF